jgi:hypothetical protein
MHASWGPQANNCSSVATFRERFRQVTSIVPTSRITGNPTQKLFDGQVLGKYDVEYFRCQDTGFIQTEEPYWLGEAYSSAMTRLDLGHVNRNIESASFVADLIGRCFPNFECGLDYGGGYGMFVRRMRDLGFGFLRSDPHCPNLFAEDFDRSDHPNCKFDIVTAFEVFEHIPNPREVVAELLEFAPTIIFSTELQPSTVIRSIEDWWYFIPETGQHISFYTRKSLEALAHAFNANFYTDGLSLHVFSRVELKDHPFPERPKSGYLERGLRKVQRMIDRQFSRPAHKARTSLLKADFERAKERLQQSMNDSSSE